MTVLRGVLVASIASTAVHYSDNAIALDRYPPDTVTIPGIVVTWVGLTAIGLLGYVLYRRERFPAAQICLAIYSITGISTLAHYLYDGTGDLEWWRHVSMVSDGVTGSAVLAFALWSLLSTRSSPALAR
jgi:hypothetical protein